MIEFHYAAMQLHYFCDWINKLIARISPNRKFGIAPIFDYDLGVLRKVVLWKDDGNVDNATTNQ